jgi:NodT family efflux transporter outer membrane factor (OMF) lipoprotein
MTDDPWYAGPRTFLRYSHLASDWRVRNGGVALLLLWTLGLAGCTVGPDFRVPDAAQVNSEAARGGFITSDPSSLASTPLPAHWWRLYDDPILDRFVHEALAANTDLRMANANLARSRAILREARTLREPSVGIESGLEYGQTSGEQYLLPIRPPVDTVYDVGATVGYDLDLFGGIRRGIEAAKADDEAVEAARDLAMVNVAAETARAYADVCGTGLQLVAARRSVELQQQGLNLTQRLFEQGRAVDLDVTRSRQLVNQLTSAVPGLQAAQRNAFYRLAVVTGRPPAQFDSALQNCSQPPRLMQALPVGDGAGLLRRRPDVRAAERQLHSATASIGVATAQLYPDIQLALPVGSVGATRDFLTAPTNYWGLGSVLKWQANQSAARARIAQANASANLALAHFDGVVLAALRDAEMALNNYVHDLAREASVKAARDDAAKAAEEAQRLQVNGRATSLAVVDAQRTLAASEQAVAQISATISSDQVAVFLALGGGWEEST